MRALSRYGLTDCARREVETMSGGQRARLQVLTLELAGVNLLLLDEPTDNLDLASAEALEVALDEFVGTVLAVTHDRWFMRGFDRFLLLDDDCTVVEAARPRRRPARASPATPAYPTSPARLVRLSGTLTSGLRVGSGLRPRDQAGEQQDDAGRRPRGRGRCRWRARASRAGCRRR